MKLLAHIWYQIDGKSRRAASPLPQASIIIFFLDDLLPWVPRRSIIFSAHPLWARQDGWRRRHEIKSNLAPRSNTSERRRSWDTLCSDNASHRSQRYRWLLGGGRVVFERLEHRMKKNYSRNNCEKITKIWQKRESRPKKSCRHVFKEATWMTHSECHQIANLGLETFLQSRL